MDTATRIDQETLAAAQRDAIRHVHLYEEPPTVPEPEVRSVATQELAAHSPDGRPADVPSRNRGRMALATMLLLCLPAVMVAVWWIGGVDALLMGLVYTVVLIMVAFPVWYSGLMRQQEAKDASDIVRHTLTSERFGAPERHQDSPRADPIPVIKVRKFEP